ncbi:hypothetical protein AALC16_17920 [Lachnospiraceae bacterium 29-91]
MLEYNAVSTLVYWVNFMKTGNPNRAGAEVWKPCTREEPAVFELC